MVAQETNASLPGCLCRPPTAFLSSTALIRGGSGFGAMYSPPRASRTTPTGGSRKEICDGRQNFGRICGRGEVFQCDRAGVTGALCPTASPRIAMSEEGVPAMFGGLVLPDLINAFATS